MTSSSIATSVYVHFPWCARKCPYCDFATTARPAGTIPHEAYAEAIIKELAARLQQHEESLQARRLVSVFFGGGTPSLWATDQIARVREAIFSAFEVRDPDGVEVTAECNPASLSQSVVDGMWEAGVRRLSIGVQSLRNDQLSFLGRLHDRTLALEALDRATRRFERVSADLMFGMPKQDELASEIDAVIATGVDHVSAYALTIEAGTLFGSLSRAGKLKASPDETYAALFEEAEACFLSHGFEHYEVSNYARNSPGGSARSEHNFHYWRGGDYLGLGAAAVGAMTERGTTTRYKNRVVAEAYLKNPGELEESEVLTSEERIQEALMLGLRTAEGVDLESLERRVGVNPLRGREASVARRQRSGDLILEDGWMRVPKARWLFLDGIARDLF